ncbi:CAZyme family GH47 [Agaricus bisporus var. burnettii]|uniref:alpha-1,2-Mannosidase n=1 Tax=Agaricus bisporus var. burnettii TaxID=192524 RepID=A0A8H7C5J3_AGABI|nr:CAZyme family GH47 [Agaricus bisporus var. burnettii]
MVHSRSLFTTVFIASVSSLLASAANVQKPDLTVPDSAAGIRDDVKDVFVKSYRAYVKQAFGHDDLAPLSGGFVDRRNGWGATIVDAMSTMNVMDLDEEFSEAVDFTSGIDFTRSKTPDTVSVFESTIRYVGGLLSAYELSDRTFPVLLRKAKELADKLAFAWVEDNDVPFGHIDFNTNTPAVENTNIAEAGTLLLEWSTLSKYTGNDTYHQLAERSLRRIATNPAPLPGLAAQGLDPRSGSPVGGYVSWGGGSDSYFEYLIKYARLNNTADSLFADTWKLAVDSSIRTLLKNTNTETVQTYLADYNSNKQIVHISSHLACFHGGNWLLGGQLLNNQTIVDVALKLVDSCWNTYSSTATGIGPEVFGFASDDGDFTGQDAPTAAQNAFYQLHGFYPIISYYDMRPEVLESNFYAWRVTGDTKYLDRAASALRSFETYLAVNDAYAPILDVNDPNSMKIDDLESFWFAETLKYLYLTFDDPSHFSLDEYIFTTEAHPLRIPTTKETYGTPLDPSSPSTSDFVPSMTESPLPVYSNNPSFPAHIPEPL